MPANETEIEPLVQYISAAIVFLLLIVFLSGFLVFYYRKKRKYDNDIIEKEKQFSQTLLQSQLEIKEQTLQNISRELHDNLGQIASLIKINLNTLQLNDAGKAAEKIEDTKELTRQLITDLKSLSLSLGSDRVTQTGLVTALQIEIERLNKTGKFTAAFIGEGNLPEIDNDKAIILYRMCQEILNNMVKHSAAPHINVLLRSTENLFTLVLSDDGVGFDVEDKKKNSGAGLLNLQSRAALINASISFHSIPRTGTTITIELPL